MKWLLQSMKWLLPSLALGAVAVPLPEPPDASARTEQDRTEGQRVWDRVSEFSYYQLNLERQNGNTLNGRRNATSDDNAQSLPEAQRPGFLGF